MRLGDICVVGALGKKYEMPRACEMEQDVQKFLGT